MIGLKFTSAAACAPRNTPDGKRIEKLYDVMLAWAEENIRVSDDEIVDPRLYVELLILIEGARTTFSFVNSNSSKTEP